MVDEFARFTGGSLGGGNYRLAPDVWPPPVVLDAQGRGPASVEGPHYMMTSRSAITDAEAATMTHVARGAVYEWIDGPDLAALAEELPQIAVLTDRVTTLEDKLRTPAPGRHWDAIGAVCTLVFVGCIDCATEEGMGYSCCGMLRCEEHDKAHRAEGVEAR